MGLKIAVRTFAVSALALTMSGCVLVEDDTPELTYKVTSPEHGAAKDASNELLSASIQAASCRGERTDETLAKQRAREKFLERIKANCLVPGKRKSDAERQFEKVMVLKHRADFGTGGGDGGGGGGDGGRPC